MKIRRIALRAAAGALLVTAAAAGALQFGSVDSAVRADSVWGVAPVDGPAPVTEEPAPVAEEPVAEEAAPVEEASPAPGEETPVDGDITPNDSVWG